MSTNIEIIRIKNDIAKLLGNKKYPSPHLSSHNSPDRKFLYTQQQQPNQVSSSTAILHNMLEIPSSSLKLDLTTKGGHRDIPRRSKEVIRRQPTEDRILPDIIYRVPNFADDDLGI